MKTVILLEFIEIDNINNNNDKDKDKDKDI